MVLPIEGTIAQKDLIKKMVLLPQPNSAADNWHDLTKPVNLIVAYNGSPSSQTALLWTMWIAHQTRLVTDEPITVQVVYVVDTKLKSNYSDISPSAEARPAANSRKSLSKSPSISTQPKPQALAGNRKKKSLKRHKKTRVSQADWFDQADQILWQARCVAKEWQGCFKAHLRFGDIALELKDVVESEAATLLFLGCHGVHHPIVQKLGSTFPCSVLGIPTRLNFEKSSELSLSI
ncbi:MAG TPA: universal stress family protein [Cyanobacteria bacterium UBA8803]|nr:universal stress family protein [Cyanobacteria bacterium UBA9273]HBL61526.1 universal stress family protein [Cyanobacteria bacterium UBA8803]